MNDKHTQTPSDDCESMLEYVRDRETSTFFELADELGIVPVIVERRFREEAERQGCLDYFLRSALVRQLYHYVPNGIRKHGEWELILALSSWIGMVGTTRELESRCNKAGDAIQYDTSIPDDWLPSSADDPVFVKFFRTT